MKMHLSNAMAEIANEWLSCLLDPDPISFKAADERGVKPIHVACDAKSPFSLKRPLNRNAFLYGCLQFTRKSDIEHLIVGLGFKTGTTTKVKSICHTAGSRDRVAIPLETVELIRSHVASTREAEAVLFHNHPGILRCVLHLLIGIPIASSTDRTTVMSYTLDPSLLVKSICGGGSVQFYLSQGDLVQRILGPNVLPILSALQRSTCGNLQ